MAVFFSNEIIVFKWKLVIFCVLTKREGDEVAHAKELSEANNLVFRFDADLLHLLNSVPDGVFVVGGDHDANLPLVFPAVLQHFDAPQALCQSFVVHVRGGFKVGAGGVGVAQGSRSGPFLLDVGASHKLGPKVKVLTFGLLQIGGHLVESLSQVALVSVEHNSLVFVVLPHELERDTGNGRLEVGLFGVDHYAHIHLLSCLQNKEKYFIVFTFVFGNQSIPILFELMNTFICAKIVQHVSSKIISIKVFLIRLTANIFLLKIIKNCCHLPM